MATNSPQEDLRKGFFFIGLAALQFGLQPFLVRWYASKAITSVVVLASELCKIVVCTALLWWQGDLRHVYGGVSFSNSIKTAGVPATIYAIINILYQISYKNLDGVMFNFLNQTKLFWCSVFLWVFLKKPQSEEQIVALVMLTVAAIMLTMGQYIDQTSGSNSFLFGILPVLTGSILSGVATTVSQKVLQNDNKNSYLYTTELAIWGIVTLIGVSFGEYEVIMHEGVFKGWTLMTTLPIFINAIGGILVGLVVKYAGGVRKGFGTVAGMFLTAVLSFFIEANPFTVTTWIALPLLISSVYIHTTYPYKAPVMMMDMSNEGKGDKDVIIDVKPMH